LEVAVLFMRAIEVDEPGRIDRQHPACPLAGGELELTTNPKFNVARYEPVVEFRRIGNGVPYAIDRIWVLNEQN
jgi:hypothetical protein